MGSVRYQSEIDGQGSRVKKILGAFGQPLTKFQPAFSLKAIKRLELLGLTGLQRLRCQPHRLEIEWFLLEQNPSESQGLFWLGLEQPSGVLEEAGV
jgi:hypothetical protein